MFTYNGQQFDGITTKPDLDDALQHYGVLGMKWRKVKAKVKSAYAQLQGKIKQKQSAAKRKERYVANKMADDILDGRRWRAGGKNSYSDWRSKNAVRSYEWSAPAGRKISSMVLPHHGRDWTRNNGHGSSGYHKGEAYDYSTSSKQLDKELERREKKKNK